MISRPVFERRSRTQLPNSRGDLDRAVSTADATDRRSIVFLIPSLIVGGAQRQLIELASGLDPDRWRVTVMLFRADGQLQSDLANRGVAVVSLNKGGRRDSLAFTYRLMRELRRRRPNILHSYLAPANVMAAAVKIFIRPTAIVWGVRASAMDFDEYRRKAGILFRVECQLARAADLIICNSSAGRDDHVRWGYPVRRTVVISNGIDIARFAPDVRARQEVRRELGIAAGERLIGIVGRLDPKKDHETFIKAASMVASQLPGARFVVVGNDPHGRRPRLTKLATEAGLGDKLEWLDARSDVERVYNALDLLVSTSSWGEGFPNVVGEAMATGVACVVTDVGDSSLVVGQVGRVCKPRDATAIADAVISLISAPDALAATSTLARERIVSLFSVARLVASTDSALWNLAID